MAEGFPGANGPEILFHPPSEEQRTHGVTPSLEDLEIGFDAGRYERTFLHHPNGRDLVHAFTLRTEGQTVDPARVHAYGIQAGAITPEHTVGNHYQDADEMADAVFVDFGWDDKQERHL